MIFIYRSKPSDGARDLAEQLCLDGVRARRTKGGFPGRVATDKVIAWGDSFAGALNGVAMASKFTDAVKLKEAGVATVEVSRSRPVATPKPPWESGSLRVSGGAFTPPQVSALAQTLQEFLAQENTRRVAWEQLPATTNDTWVGRLNSHIGGNDLLAPPNGLNGRRVAEFYVKKLDIKEEYRIHCFLGKSIRAGIKVPREDGVTVHPWVRSFNGGWRIKYDEFKSKESMRVLAAKAVEALGLDFGAVDLARLRDNSLLVLEVNRAPGLEGGTLEAYARAIKSWINA